MTSPYRPEPCEKCHERKEASKAILPFSDRPCCPECDSGEGYHMHWKYICRGGGHRFITKMGEKRLFRSDIPEKFVTCPHVGDAPKHFHFVCEKCGTHWQMLTKTETPKGGKEDEGDGDNPFRRPAPSDGAKGVGKPPPTPMPGGGRTVLERRPPAPPAGKLSPI